MSRWFPGLRICVVNDEAHPKVFFFLNSCLLIIAQTLFSFPLFFFFLSLNRALLNHSTYLASRHGKLAERERQLKERQLTFSIVCYVVKKKKKKRGCRGQRVGQSSSVC